MTLYRLTARARASNFPPRYNIAPTQKSFVVRLTLLLKSITRPLVPPELYRIDLFVADFNSLLPVSLDFRGR
jgi:hypothetical protein